MFWPASGSMSMMMMTMKDVNERWMKMLLVVLEACGELLSKITSVDHSRHQQLQPTKSVLTVVDTNNCNQPTAVVE